ncbi:MAG: hypothetical protein KGD59_03115 [Candidatus Heimdallarchaeota archaeon]|nr:hypothetical protein [Candidatus Heimdallarchaeota archaeon]MBY8993513.1 hypothetical protein [Candidatus Heimdallarchaeota archaeon]
MNEEISLNQKIDNMKKTTEFLLALDESFTLTNGWKARELLLHLWCWDDEFVKICEFKMKDSLDQCEFEFQKMKIEYSEWNDYMLDKMKEKSFKEAKEKFKVTRLKIIELFEDLIKLPEIVDDEKSFYRTDKILDLWQHDKQHLEAGGAKIEF